jgi:hypothetical protein
MGVTLFGPKLLAGDKIAAAKSASQKMMLGKDEATHDTAILMARKSKPKRATTPKRTTSRANRRNKKPEVEVAAIGTAEKTTPNPWSLGGLLKVAVDSFLLLVTPRPKIRKRSVEKVDTESATKPVAVRFRRRKKAAAK